MKFEKGNIIYCNNVYAKIRLEFWTWMQYACVWMAAVCGGILN